MSSTSPEPPELLPVPTVQDLVRRGLATAIMTDKQGNVTAAVVSTKGHDLMGEAMLENGRRMRAYDEARRPTAPSAAPRSLPPDDPWFDLGSRA